MKNPTPTDQVLYLSIIRDSRIYNINQPGLSSLILFIIFLIFFTSVANAQVNNTTESLGIQDIGDSPAVQQMLREKAAYSKHKLHIQHPKSRVNTTLNSLGIPDLSSDPVNRQAAAQETALQQTKLYKPNTNDIVIGRGVNIDKADLDKYFPNGVDLSLSDAQLNSRLDELKREEVYKYLCIIGAILLLGFIVARYFKDKSMKKIGIN